MFGKVHRRTDPLAGLRVGSLIVGDLDYFGLRRVKEHNHPTGQNAKQQSNRHPHVAKYRGVLGDKPACHDACDEQ
jgi:hypothetical protein